MSVIEKKLNKFLIWTVLGWDFGINKTDAESHKNIITIVKKTHTNTIVRLLFRMKDFLYLWVTEMFKLSRKSSKKSS